MTELYQGVPVIEQDMRFFKGSYRNGVIYVKRGLQPEVRGKTLRHEYLHHQFYSAHRWLECHELNVLLMCCAPFVASFSPAYAFTPLLLPVFIEAAHELSVNMELDDIGARAIIKAGICALGIAACMVIGLAVQHSRGVL